MHENEEIHITIETILDNNSNTTSTNTSLIIFANNAIKTKNGRIFNYSVKIIAIFA